MSIIDKAKKGDSESFVALIEQYKVQMYKTAKAILRDEDDVCDAIQDAIMSAYKSIKSVKQDKYFKTWLIRITINKCYDIIEANNSINTKRDKTIIVEEGKTDNLEDQLDLCKALEAIDNDLRIVTTLYYYDDISIKDIADILGIPTGTVKSKLARARERLYELLKQEEVSEVG